MVLVNGYDMHFMLPPGKKYDPYMLNGISVTMFMDLYRAAFTQQPRAELQPRMHEFMYNCVEKTLWEFPAPDAETRVTLFFAYMFDDADWPRGFRRARKFMPDEYATLGRQLYRGGTLPAEVVYRHHHDFAELMYYLNWAVVGYLEELYNPEKRLAKNYQQLSAVGWYLFHRMCQSGSRYLAGLHTQVSPI